LSELFGEHPGYYFVAATLVPLVSFLLILLASAMWCATRPFRYTPAGAALFNFFGGEQRGRGAAYVATAAIAIAFFLVVAGFIRFTTEQSTFETRIAGLEKDVRDLQAQKAKATDAKEKEELHENGERVEKQLTDVEGRWEHLRNTSWQSHFDWLRIHPAHANDSERGTILQLGFKIDSLSGLMFVMVTFIATLIHLFSMGYMADELQPEVEDHQVHTAHGHLHRRGRFGRFFMYLSLFCFSMLNLLLADNLFQVFVSWELVGVCSYLLVGFYFERTSAANAANKAFIVNRIGDAGFILGLLIVWTSLGTFNFDEIFKQVRAPLTDTHGPVRLAGRFVRGNLEAENASGNQSLKIADNGSQLLLFPRAKPGHYHAIGNSRGEVDVSAAPKSDEHSSMPYWMLVAAGLGIFLGCVGKSAQFPLHVWLPDAME